jgi:hypothetical protein
MITSRNEMTTTATSVSSPVTSTPIVSPSAKAEMDTLLVQIAVELAAEVRKCQAFSIAWMIKAGEHLRECRRQLPHGDWTALFTLKRVPVGQRAAQLLARIAGNGALCNVSLLEKLPQSLAALDALAALDSQVIEEGVRNGSIHRGLTTREVRMLVRKKRKEQPAVLSQPPTSPRP